MSSHHPLIAYIDDVKLGANMWLRSGDTSSANKFLAFLKDTLAKLKDSMAGLVRLDSGLCQSHIFDCLEERQVDYIISGKFTHPIQRLIAGAGRWVALDDGIEICELYYQGWCLAKRGVL